MVPRFVAAVLCLLSLIILSTVSPLIAGGPPVCAPPSCGPAPVSCAPEPCAPSPCGTGGQGFLGAGCFGICANICGAVIGCPAAVMNWILAPSPAPGWGRGGGCAPPSCGPISCPPPVCPPPVCAPAPITKCKPVTYGPPVCGPVGCPPPVPQCGPVPQGCYGSGGASTGFGLFSIFGGY